MRWVDLKYGISYIYILIKYFYRMCKCVRYWVELCIFLCNSFVVLLFVIIGVRGISYVLIYRSK